MPAEAAFKKGLADFAAGHEPDERFSQDSLIQAAYRSGWDAAKRQAELRSPLASGQPFEVTSRVHSERSFRG
jgi:hypothetical protein